MTLQHNRSLKSLNTFGIEAYARLLAEIRSPSDLAEVLGDAALKKEPALVLGGGSNILLTGNYDGLVLLNRLEGISRVSETGDSVLIKAYAGTVWHDLVLYAIENNLGGIENLSLIPGC